MAINKVKVTGDIYVPATGTELVTNGDFANWDDASTPTGWDISTLTANAETSEVAFNEGHGGVGSGSCNIWTDDKSLVFISQDNIFTIGKRYRLSYDITVISGELSVTSGNQSTIYDTVSSSEIGRTVDFTAASDLRIRFLRRQSFNCDITINNISVLELTPGPIDTYRWDNATDYSSGGEPLGILNGERVYESNNTLANGTGGVDNWFIWRFTNGAIVITPGDAALSSPRWGSEFLDTLIGDYNPRSGPPPSTGVATVSLAPGGGRYSGGGGYRKPYRARRY
jgi:hypothetical protein